jgi:hypothetical protein
MKTIRLFSMLVLVLALLLGFRAMTVVAGEATPDPLSAPYLDTQAHPIAPNEAQWYRFDYKGDESTISLKMLNAADVSLNFEIYAPDQIGKWWKYDAVGMGTDNGDNHTWTGSFPVPGTYYVRVMNNEPFALNFQFTVTGKGVVLGTPVTAPPVSAPVVVSPKKVANIDPPSAVVIDNAAKTIAGNTSLWYRYDFASDTQLTLRMPNGDASKLAFKVFGPDQIGTWWKADPLGDGSKDGNDLIWVGSAYSGTTLYIEVVNDNPYVLSFTFMTETEPVTR